MRPIGTFVLLAFALTAGVVPGQATSNDRSPVPASLTVSAAPKTEFAVRVSRFFLFTTRKVVATAALDGLNGRLEVALDRPVYAILGIKRLGITVHLLDENGREIDRLQGALEDGDSSVSFPVTLPAPGRYRFVLEDDDIVAGAATTKVLPAGRATLEVESQTISQ